MPDINCHGGISQLPKTEPEGPLDFKADICHIEVNRWTQSDQYMLYTGGRSIFVFYSLIPEPSN
jgi:hypothetical protein